MKIQAWGWLIAGVMALGLNGFYHDGGFAWAHRKVADFEHNTSAVLALASGRADEFLAEVKPVVVHEETASCRMATLFARVQSKVARMQTEFAPMQLAQLAPVQAYQVNVDQLKIDQVKMDRFLAAQVAASDRLQAMSDRRQAAMERMAAQQTQVRARMMAKIARVQAMPAMQYTSFEIDCPQVHVHVPRVRVPEVNVPEINVPQIHVPHVHVPQISVPAVNVGAGPV